MSNKSIFSSTLCLEIPDEISKAIMNIDRVKRVHLIGTATAFVNNLGGGWEGFFRSNIMVKFGTITIVMMYTTMIPPASPHPTV